MRTGLIVFGIIFLVIGGLLYLVPVQELRADTTTTNGGITDLRTSSASVTVPIGWAYASGLIGFILLIFGLVIPGSRRRESNKNSYEKVSTENIEVGEGNKRRIIRASKESQK